MKMRVTSRAVDKKLQVNNTLLQTLPKKDKRIRKAFIPSPGYKLMFSDLDQIEYRLLAHYAQTDALIDAIHKGHDVHQATAATIFKVPYDEVTEEQRTKAKTVNFSLTH
jgi:DNA polymerase-1